MARIYRSMRVAHHHPPFRPYGGQPPDPTYQLVRGYPPDCSCANHLAFVGEAPGADEDQAGFPFVGRSGEELDRFCDTWRINPDDCFITNIGRIFRPGNPDPIPEDIETWESLLHDELNIARPWWIASVGRISTRYFLGDVDMETVHGIPYLVVLPWLDNGRGGRVVVIPIYHPAAGFHSTEIQALIAYDFSQLALTLEGRLAPRPLLGYDPYPNPVYVDLDDSDDSCGFILDQMQRPEDVAVDTEGLPGKPWGLSWSNQPGTAYVIRRVHERAIHYFHQALTGLAENRSHHVLLHNSLHDLRVLRELAVPIPSGSFIDTMVLAYHLCVEPQGLKSLAYRHCGMEMASYDEIVSDAQDRIALEYYRLMDSLTTGGRKRRKLHIWFDEWEREIRREYREVGKPSEIVSAFPVIPPYEILERDKATGQLHTRIKHPHQVWQRVWRALAEVEAGTLTLHDLRNRWNQTDELVTSVVESVIGEMREADLDDVPLDRAINYAARDADATKRIAPLLLEKHRAMGLARTSEIDHAIIPMVDEMQANGMPIDRPYLEQLSKDLARRMVEVQDQIKQQFGVWINPNSGDQVADVLFRPVEEGGYGLTATKKTKGTVNKVTGEVKKRRGSTQDKVLEGLRGEHPIIPLILDYRGLNKAKTSFADVALRRAVNEGGMWVVHCNFRITRVSSGRLSATGPNLLAIIGDEKLGKEVRTGYVAGSGYEFATWDLNQIEMRVMADEAQDEFLIGMFMNDEDVHAGTADKMFSLGLTRPYNKKQVKKEQRDPAKRTGFGVITGIQAPGLVDQMRLQGIIISEEEAAGWIEGWLAACPMVKMYMHRCHREAAAFGFVREWAGRIRYLPGIHSPFRHIRAEAGRQSHSHKIQAGAQSIMKIAMATMHSEILPYWREKGRFIAPVLQVHDEVMFRIKGFSSQDLDELNLQMRAALFSAAPPGMKVPLDAGWAMAKNWAELEK